MADAYTLIDDWRTWRLEAHGLTWRLADPDLDREDIEAIRQPRVEGDHPDLFARPVLITLVAEDETGRIVDATYVELLAHIAKVTRDRRGFASFPDLLPVIGGFLKHHGVRVAEMSVPSRWNRAMRPLLVRMGFCSTEHELVRWVRRV